MAKINQKEYDILKGLDDKWEWIARDGGVFESLCVYSKPPKKGVVCWGTVSPIDEWESLSMSNSFFQFIKWEDEEPYSIQELIEEYESSKEIILHEDFDVDNLTFKELDGFKQTLKVIKESEETEVKKDIEWLKNLIGKNFHKYTDMRNEAEDEEDRMYYQGKVDGLYIALRLINQLDEPEVVTQKWIDANTSPVDDEGRLYIWESDLQDLIVPKQETSKQTDINVGLLKERIKTLEKYNEELIRDNNQLRSAMDNEEVLTPDWIDKHEYEEEELESDTVFHTMRDRKLIDYTELERLADHFIDADERELW